MIKQENHFQFTCDICKTKSYDLVAKNKTEARKFIEKQEGWKVGRDGKKLIDVCKKCQNKGKKKDEGAWLKYVYQNYKTNGLNNLLDRDYLWPDSYYKTYFTNVNKNFIYGKF